MFVMCLIRLARFGKLGMRVHTEVKPGLTWVSLSHLVMQAKLGLVQFNWFTLQFIPRHTMLYLG